MKITATGASHRGNIRGHNEDNIYVDGAYRNDLSMDNVLISSRRTSGPYTYAVFDGLGGEACGEQASLIAALGLKAIEDRGHIKDIDTYIITTHKAILNESVRRDARNMGTTVAVVCVDGNTADVFNVGDSKVYLYRAGTIRQLSKDHSVAQSLIDSGLLKEADKSSSIYASELTQYVGMNSEEDIEPSAYQTTVNIVPGDIILLCSDGLTGELSDKEILDLIDRNKSDTTERLAVKLVKKAVERQGRDNVSVIVVSVMQ